MLKNCCFALVALLPMTAVSASQFTTTDACNFTFSDGELPNFRLPEAGPNSPGDVQLNIGNSIITRGWVEEDESESSSSTLLQSRRIKREREGDGKKMSRRWHEIVMYLLVCLHCFPPAFLHWCPCTCVQHSSSGSRCRCAMTLSGAHIGMSTRTCGTSTVPASGLLESKGASLVRIATIDYTVAQIPELRMLLLHNDKYIHVQCLLFSAHHVHQQTEPCTAATVNRVLTM